ncbi:MHC class II transactivator isoform X2 [Sceloporus undulatus]|nr:MHC class II transactivator isoform X2 [Sceloporus undulatus]XP_042293592.1 MHC class II transactivator isoform X2 [Sceloporus undulatus]
MDLGPLLGKSYLELLQSELDDWVLSQEVEEVAEFHTGPSIDTLNDADVLSMAEGEEEAYDKIAALAEYLLKDHQEKPVEEVFGSLVSEEDFAESPRESCLEGKKRRSCSEALEPKRRKVAHSPAVCVLNDPSANVPLNGCCPVADQPNFHLQFSVTTVGLAGRTPKILEPSASPHLEYYLLNPKDIQVILTFEPLVQQTHWLARPEDTTKEGCPGKEGKTETGPDKSPPVPSEQIQKRPESVDAFCTELKSHFRDSCHFGKMEGEAPLDHLYLECNLAEFPSEDKGRRSTDPEEKSRTPVERRHLFQTPGRNDPSTKTIVLLGEAGMGKSLLAQKICLEWSEGQWPKYDFVFRFDCGHLNTGSHQNLKSLLFEHSALSQEELNEVYKYVLHNPEKVLLIFDGFEELKDHDSFTKPCPERSPRWDPCGTGATLASLFQKKLLNGCTLLLMARPKGKLHQCLPKADKILELTGFSMQQAKMYIAQYFEGLPTCDGAATLIQKSPYLFSHCHRPDLCRFICESVFQTEGIELPSTLTSLFVKSLLQKMAHATENKVHPKRHLATLGQMAWDVLQNHQKVFTSSHFSSGEVKEFALDYGLVVPLLFPENSSNETEECGRFAFPNSVVQNFLLALHLVLAKEIKDKKLTQHLCLLSKAKKSLSSSSSLDLVPRFLSGLLFLEDNLLSPLLFGEEGEQDVEKMVAKKKKSLSKYIRRLPIRDFSPGRLLQLFHCVHETEDTYLLQHLALELRSNLSFMGFSLAPSDIHVLSSVLKRSAKETTLDFRGSSIDSEGLRQLVVMKNVSAFRASLSHAIDLWKHLWETKQEEQLRSAMEKFITLPFKAQAMKDVEDLSALVHLEEEMAQSQADSNGCKIHRIPAVADFKQIEFMMGPISGLKGFQKLVQILDAFPCLQHLDLDSPKENEIGDEGVLSLCKVLPRLHSLETLNLSRNKITDLGAERLSAALPSLPSLKTLSLYNNRIGDAGAEHLAEMLPKMPSLRVLDIHCNQITAAGAHCLTDSLKCCPWVQSMALWSPAIPHGVLDHLQQLDPRIRLL